MNLTCTPCYAVTAHSNDSCSVLRTSWTQNIQHRISSFSCPSPSCVFTKNFHFLHGTDTSSGHCLTLFSSSRPLTPESQLLQGIQHLLKGFRKPIKTHGKGGIALEKTIFCPRDLMNVSLTMLARDTRPGKFSKCNRCTTTQIFSYSVDSTGRYFLCLNRVKLSHRSHLPIYKGYHYVGIQTYSLPFSINFVLSPWYSHTWKAQTCSAAKYTSALTPVIPYCFRLCPRRSLSKI